MLIVDVYFSNSPFVKQCTSAFKNCKAELILCKCVFFAFYRAFDETQSKQKWRDEADIGLTITTRKISNVVDS